MPEVDLADAVKSAVVPYGFAVGIVDGELADGAPGHIVAIHVKGRRLGTQHEEAVTLALTPSDTAALFREVAETLQRLAPPRDSFGRPE